MLLSETDGKLIQKDIEQVRVTQAVSEATHQKITQANKSLSDMHKKRLSIVEKEALTLQPKTTGCAVKKRQL